MGTKNVILLRDKKNDRTRVEGEREELNIGVQFGRLFFGQGPIRSMTVEEKELTLHRRCLECE